MSDWQLVPKVLTDDMVVAFAEEWYSHRQTIDEPEMESAYEAMLLVAPTASPEDHSVLRALASACLAVTEAGAWHAERDVVGDCLNEMICETFEVNRFDSDDDREAPQAEYIAAVSPSVVLGLLDEIEALRQALSKCTDDRSGCAG